MTLRSAQIRHDRQRVTAQFVGQERRPGFSPGVRGGAAGEAPAPARETGGERERGAGADESPRRPPCAFPGAAAGTSPSTAGCGRASFCILPLERAQVKSPPKHRSLRLTRASPARTLCGVLRREVNARALRSPCAGERG